MIMGGSQSKRVVWLSRKCDSARRRPPPYRGRAGRTALRSMIPKSGHRFSEPIMLRQISMIPKKPAPDLIRGGHCVSEKIGLQKMPGTRARSTESDHALSRAVGPAILEGDADAVRRPPRHPAAVLDAIDR